MSATVSGGWGVFNSSAVTTNNLVTFQGSTTANDGYRIAFGSGGSPLPERDPLRWLRSQVDEICALGRLDA